MTYKREQIDLKYKEPHYSTRILKAFIIYLQEHCGEEYVHKIFYEAGVDYDYVTNENNWVSDVLFDNLYRLLDSDPLLPNDFAYQLQRYSNDRKHLTALHRTATLMLGVKKIYMHMAKMTNTFNKVDHFSLREKGEDQFLARFESSRNTPHIEQIVEGWRGYLETIPCLVNEIPATVEVEKTGNEYLFSIKVNRSKTKVFSRVMTAFHFLSFLIVAGFIFYKDFGYFSWLHGVFFAMIGSVSINALWLFKYIIDAHEKSTQGLLETNKAYEKRYIDIYNSQKKIQLKSTHAEVLKKVSTFSLKAKNLNHVLDFSLKQVVQHLKFSRTLALLIDEKGELMTVISHKGFEKEFQRQVLSHLRIVMSHRKKDPLLFHNLVYVNEQIVVHDVETYKAKLEKKNKEIMDLLEVEQFIIAPLFEGTSRYGLLVVDRSCSEGKLVEEDLHTIAGLSNQLSISIGHFYTQDRLARSQSKLKTSLETTQKIAHFVPKQLKRSIEQTSFEGLYTTCDKSTSSVAFIDIAQYTRLSEILEPAQMVQFLNEIFKLIDPIVEKYEGDIDKRIGDCTMVVFPADEKERWEFRPSWRAVQCLCEIKKQLDQFRFESDFIGIWQVNYHIGAATGPLVHANIGSPLRLEHTVLGDTVNVASRLEGVSNNTVIVNDRLYEDVVDNVQARCLEGIELKNKTLPVGVYEIDSVHFQEKQESEQSTSKPLKTV